MKNTIKILLLLLFIIILGLSSCSAWKQDAKIDDFINLDIKEIIICTPDSNNIDEWTSLLTVSEPEKIREIVKALENATKIRRACSADKMKIITTTGKFIMDFGRDDNVAYGNHFESAEFLKLLKEYGLRLPAELKAGDPNNDQQRWQKLIELRMKRLKEKEPNSN